MDASTADGASNSARQQERWPVLGTQVVALRWSSRVGRVYVQGITRSVRQHVTRTRDVSRDHGIALDALSRLGAASEEEARHRKNGEHESSHRTYGSQDLLSVILNTPQDDCGTDHSDLVLESG